MGWQKLTSTKKPSSSRSASPYRKTSSSSIDPSSASSSCCCSWEWTSELQELTPILLMYGIFILLTVSIGLAISIASRPDFAWTPHGLIVPLTVAGLGTVLVVAGVLCHICVGESDGIFGRRRMRGRFDQQQQYPVADAGGSGVGGRYAGDSEQLLRVSNLL